MLSYLAAALFAVLPADLQAARQDYAQQPPQVKPYIRYVTTSHVDDAAQPLVEAALKFQVASASTAPVLDRHVPEEVAPGVFRLNLQELRWDYRDWNKVLESYPYERNDPYHPLLAIRGDWLVYNLSDPSASDAYYRLLYGGNRIPKSRDELFKFWGTDPTDKKQLSQGWIENQSLVAKQNTRFITHLDREGGSYWFTRDVLRITGKTDPLGAPDGKFAHDGEEHIIGFRKVSIRHRSTGQLQAYALFNGQGKKVDKAPVDLVEDYTRFKGKSEIVNNGSCVQCHTLGMQFPNENGIQSLLQDGVELKSKDYLKAEFIERFHLSDVAKQLKRDNEDYAIAIKAINGLTPPENAAAYKVANDWYGGDLSLDQAARELNCTPEHLRLSLAYASSNYIDLGPRMSALAHGRKVPRTAFEEQYQGVQKMLVIYGAKK